jgi:hypothetical protein
MHQLAQVLLFAIGVLLSVQHAGAQTLIIDAMESSSIASWSGTTLTLGSPSPSASTTNSLCWNNTVSSTSIGRSSIPHDWSAYNK